MRSGRDRGIAMFEIFAILLFLINILFLHVSNFYIITGIVLALVVILIKFLKVGFEKRDHRYLKDVLLVVANASIFYVLFYYLSGLIFGFLKSSYGLRPDIILRNIVPVIIIIVSSEILRYILNHRIKEKISLLTLSVILFVFIDISLNLYQYDLSTNVGIIYLLANCIIPSIFKNALLTFLSLKAGHKPTIAYRLITELPIFLTPIIPDIPAYLYILLNIVFNWCLCMYLVNIYVKHRVESPKQKRHYLIPTVIVGIMMSVTIYLCCGYFTYSIIAIGSGSMESTICKGDAVIYQKTDPSELNISDIIVFKKENKRVVHRIVSIERENESYYIKTKGDNNSEVDNWIVTNDEIIGIVRTNIKYIGYPTIWISELIK